MGATHKVFKGLDEAVRWIRENHEEPELEHLGWMLSGSPEIVARASVERVLGIKVSRAVLSKDDSAGVGPRVRFHIGRDVHYWVPSLLEYIERTRIRDGEFKVLVRRRAA